MNLLSHLRAMSHAELEEVVASRPELLQTAQLPRPRLDDLATVLLSEPSISRALAGLDRFHWQLLYLAAASSGGVEPETADDQGISREALAAAARTFNRLALAAPEAGGFRLFHPVTKMVARSNPLGLNMPSLLEQETVDLLQERAHALAIRADGSKADLIARIVSHLSDRHFLTALVEGAPPEAQRVLSLVRRRGGRVSLYDLAAELGHAVSGYRRRYNSRGHKSVGLHWLESRALLFTHPWMDDVLVPAQVELALRGRAFPSWAAEPPPTEMAHATFDRGPLDVVEEMSRLLGELAQAEAPLLKTGDLGVRERRRMAVALGLDEDRITDLLRMANWVELLSARTETRAPTRRGRGWVPEAEDSYLTISPKGRRWLEAGPAEAWLTLFRGYMRVISGDVWIEDRQASLRPLLTALRSLPFGQGVRCESLGRRLAWLHPGTWSSDESATSTVTSSAAWLSLLGAGSQPPVLGLSSLGRAALAGASVLEVEQLLPNRVDECRVQADLTVIVAGPPSAVLSSGLALFAQLESQSSARIYRLTSASVRRALDRGMTPPEIEHFLEYWSSAELPSTVRELIREVGRRHGRLRVGQAAGYIVGDDEATVAEMVANRKLRSLRLRQIAPTVAIAEASSQKAVVEALRKAGLMPVADRLADPPSSETTAAVPARSTVEDLVPPMPGPNEAQVTPAMAKALADKLRSDDVRDGEREGSEPRVLYLFGSRGGG